ncbi:Double-stranded RNA-binding domain [Dillenia turbinata]|uniref:Double-stranded RNA-binding domain n=1 Tax=Dillenia turbinata TaxID=194707 RepID=A0AAN8VRJ8_9MAGN
MASSQASLEKEGGSGHCKTFICSVQIPTGDGVLYIKGNEKSRVKDAQNSAASMMLLMGVVDSPCILCFAMDLLNFVLVS